MAVVGSRAQYASMEQMARSGGGPWSAVSNRKTPVSASSHAPPFASPTESEFSEAQDVSDSVR